MITFEDMGEFKSELEVTEEPEIVITISGAKHLDSMHIIFRSGDEEEEPDNEI